MPSLTSTERLFCDMLADLEHIQANPNTYLLTRSSVALRQLLLDSNGVLHHVNRVHRVKLRFPVSPQEAEPDEEAFLIRGFSRSQTGPLDEFLAQPCIWRQGFKYTVRDVIDICANKEGGVHLDKRLDGREQTLLNVTWAQEGMRIGAYDTPLLFVVSQIVGATLEALDPLRAAVLRQPRRQQPIVSNSPPTKKSWLGRWLDRLFLPRAASVGTEPAKDPRPVITGRTFHRERVELSAYRFDRCVFDECRITYTGLHPVRLRGCEMTGCTFEMFGAALHTLRYFQAMYQTGGEAQRMVQATMAEPLPDGRPRSLAWND